MRIFITGATGFIGLNLALKLADEGHIIHALYRSPSKTKPLNHNNIKLFQGDINDYNSIEQAMLDCEQVYHVAAYARSWAKKPDTFYKINVTGTINILKAAKKHNIKRIVYTSTAGIFGPTLHNEYITEETINKLPYFTPYEESKSMSEQKIHDFAGKGMDIITVNPTRVFGPGLMNESNSVTKMIRLYLKGKWYFIPGNGKSIGNYVFIDDVVNGHIMAMKYGKSGERYILGGENISYNTFFKILKKKSGKKIPLFKLPYLFMLFAANFILFLSKIIGTTPMITPAHVKKFNHHWKVSSNKAINELNYNITSFEKAIVKTLEWLRNK